jgi:type VI secretion system protein ImpM
MSPSLGWPRCGFYGKLPLRGDFVRRDLDDAFVSSWDNWIESGLQRFRLLDEDGWLARYLEAPIWHFILGEGAHGPAAVAGVMIPSVDLVGRYFPLTLAASLPPGSNLASFLLGNDEWFSVLEETALAGLEADVEFDDFVERVAAIAPPAVESGPNAGRWVASGRVADHAARLARLVASATSLRSTSIWRMQDGAPRETETMLIQGGPPNDESFGALMDLDWERRGWNRL